MTAARRACATLILVCALATPTLAQDKPKPRERASPWVVLAITLVVGGLVVLLRNHMARREEANAPRAGRLDPSEQDPVVQSLRGELRAGAWEGAQAKLEATTDWPERDYLLNAITSAAAPETLARWIEAAPRSAAARLMRGSFLLRAAERARGAGLARDVAEEDMQTFERLSAESDAELLAAAELDPRDPTPLALRLTTAIGMRVDEPEQAARFRAATARDRWNLTAHLQRFTLLCAKWGGSHEAMFELARRSSAEAPEGSPVHALVPLAHIERWLAGVSGFDEEEPPPGFEGEYFLDREVQEEVLAAHARSIGSRSWREERHAVARNLFAFAFWRAEDWPRLRAELERIGAAWTPYPWGYAGHAPVVVARARVQAGLFPDPTGGAQGADQ